MDVLTKGSVVISLHTHLAYYIFTTKLDSTTKLFSHGISKDISYQVGVYFYFLSGEKGVFDMKSLVKHLDWCSGSPVQHCSVILWAHYAHISHPQNRLWLTCISDGWIEHCHCMTSYFLSRLCHTPAVPGVHSTFTEALSYVMKDQVQNEWTVWIQCPYCRKQHAVHPPLPQWFHSGESKFVWAP